MAPSTKGLGAKIADVLLSYETIKIVTIKNKKVGFLHRFIQLAILGYVIGYECCMNLHCVFLLGRPLCYRLAFRDSCCVPVLLVGHCCVNRKGLGLSKKSVSFNQLMLKAFFIMIPPR